MTCQVFTIKSESRRYFHLLSHAERYQHPHFWFHDGDTIISAEDVYFRIHSARVVPLSLVLLRVFNQAALETKPPADAPEKLYFLPELKGGHIAWSCLLGLIYNKESAIANPSFHELLATTRVTMIYQFTRIHLWALACMRRSFFKAPENMQVDTGETVEEKLENAIEVFNAWWFPRADLHNRTLAIYALARLDNESHRMRQLKQNIHPQAWHIIADARSAMEARYVEIMSHVANIGHQSRESFSHCPDTCQRCLLDWMQYARQQDRDILRVLRHLRYETPLGPLCQDCINDVRIYLDKAYKETSHSLPIYTGCHGQKVEDWDISPAFIDTNCLLSPL